MEQPRDGQLLAHQAQLALWEALRDGRLRDGQFLSMAQLVGLLDFPIAAIREAVKQASAQGLLSALPKRGIQVMEAHPEAIRECLDFRMALDQEGARRRIRIGNLEGLDALRERHEGMRNTAETDAAKDLPTQAIKVDLSLHDYLAEGLRNSHLTAAYAANRMRMAIIQNSRPFLQDRIFSAMEEHLAIIDAIENRDVETAIDAIQYHCDQTLRWWGIT
ncbi:MULTISPECIES: GntR family transcriptional regulator [Halocynthiibacter]|uniref:GntR family transcriptional regulator n=1 Tax=Halocynthiibacter halioticoli TaxID=2986804 RepID=A0AAE3J4I7_9RHOB|nr:MULTISPECIES: GntR family transcriptional regulator [Halocynthiibacter]MCV6825797.1 GntR family transcriptional regulator [Halocynthiibacter halioticoli]MCW4058798.1 GntR family transcriptional regulator [Halocynthiibacter sp. SDUM655004]